MKNFIFTLFITCCCFTTVTAQWLTYTSPNHTFKIQFPGQPKIMNMGPSYGMDSTKIFQYFQMDSTDSFVYMLNVQYASNKLFKPELNEQQRYEIFKGFGEAGIGLIGKILQTEKISFKGYPGVFIKGEITQATKAPFPPIFVKSFLVENRIYTLTVTCDTKNKEDPAIDRFFESFEILNK